MRIKIPSVKMLAPVAVAGLMVVVGCTDDKYDLNEVDLTVGVGGGELELPGSSTTDIKLDDVLDLDGSDCVAIDDNGDYVFAQEGADVEPVKVRVEQIVVTEKVSEAFDVSFTLPNIPSIPGQTGTFDLGAEGISTSGKLHVFEYRDDNAPAELVTLDGAKVNENFTLKVKFSDDLKRFVHNLSELSIEFPAYMKVNISSAPGGRKEGSKLLFENVSTAGDLVIRGNVSELDFTEADKRLGKLELKDENGRKVVTLDGNIYVSARFRELYLDGGSLSGANLSIGSEVSMERFVITSITGRIDPKIDLTDLGDAHITGVPEFLKDDAVRIDLYNPRILITLDGNMDIEGTVSGVLKAYKEGRGETVINVPDMRINVGEKTDICICRVEDEAVRAEGYDQVIVIPELSTLIEVIPDKVTFSAEAKADNTKPVEFKLGHDYELKPSYSIKAPLAFAENACIVYTDSIDDLNDDLKDIDLSSNASLEITADVDNHIPAYLEISAVAVDVNGREMAPEKVKVDVEGVVAAYDGGESNVTPLKVIARQQTKGALKELGKIRFTVKAMAKADGKPAVTGQVLNARRHYIKANNISVKLAGKVIADLN